MTRPLSRLLARLRRDQSGLAMLEFALSFPLVAGLGLYSIELVNYALVTLKVNQIALNLADNASRVGTDATLAQQQLREVDMNDVLQGARYQGQSIGFTTYGRVTISSLENISGTQYIHWQRCIGLRNGDFYESHYGTTNVADGTDTMPSHAGTPAPNGMGDPGYQVSAPQGYGVMFVEVNYDYQPLISAYFIGAQRIHYNASYIVRDNRDFTQIYNPSPAASRSTCDLHAI